MTTNVNNILGRLNKVRNGKLNDSWLACCPAHEDRSPSLSIRELSDGKILLHCFAGCSIGDVLGALGMTIDELFPERLTDARPMTMPFVSNDVLRALRQEIMVVALAGSELAADRSLTPEERERLFVAVGRINAGLRLAGVRDDA